MEQKLWKKIFYILEFINSARFMTSSLSNLVDNLSERIHKINCKYRHNDKKRAELNISKATVFLKTWILKTI